MIDLHAHLLPGIDDGPTTTDEAVAMARAARDDGIETVVTTPHVDHVHGVDPFAILNGALRLRAALVEAGVELKVLTGAEVTILRAAEMTDLELGSVALGTSRCVLLECPLRRGGGSVEEALFALDLRRFTVLLAHPERSPDLLGDVDRVRELVERGAYCSITAGSILGRFGPLARTFAFRLLGEGLVHNIASDGHDNRKRPMALRLALGVAGRTADDGDALAHWLARDVPLALLADRPLPPAPAPAQRAPRLRRRSR